MDLTLDSTKRLKSKKKIGRLFESGRGLHKSPVRVVFYIDKTIEIPGFQLTVSVPKRNFKRATQRNLLKRRMREAFRIHQHQLNLKNPVDLMLIYTSNELKDFSVIEKSVLQLIQTLNSIGVEKIEEK